MFFDVQQNSFIAWFEQTYNQHDWDSIIREIKGNPLLQRMLAFDRKAYLPGSLTHAAQQALKKAVVWNHVQMIELLLSAGVNVNVRYFGEETLLMMAAMHGHAETVQVLCNGGADVDARDAKGFTALMWAAANGYVDVVQALLNAGANQSVHACMAGTALMLAASRAHMSTLRKLQCSSDSSIVMRHAEVVQLLIMQKDKKDMRLRAALMEAIAHQQMDTVEVFLKAGVSPTCYEKQETPFMRLISLRAEKSALQCLFQYGLGREDRTSSGETMLMFAVRKRAQTAIEFLTSSHVSVDLEEKNKRGCTALMLASQLGMYKVCKCLVRQGARVDTVDTDGNSLYMRAKTQKLKNYFFSVSRRTLDQLQPIEVYVNALEPRQAALKRGLYDNSIFQPDERCVRAKPSGDVVDLTQVDMHSEGWSAYNF